MKLSVCAKSFCAWCCIYSITKCGRPGTVQESTGIFGWDSAALTAHQRAVAEAAGVGGAPHFIGSVGTDPIIPTTSAGPSRRNKPSANDQFIHNQRREWVVTETCRDLTLLNPQDTTCADILDTKNCLGNATTACCLCGGGFKNMPSYTHYVSACIWDYNGQCWQNQSVADCAAKCHNSTTCHAFEYGVNYNRSWFDGQWVAGQCCLQTSGKKSLIDSECTSYNIDLYVKENVVPGYSQYREACISGHNLEATLRGPGNGMTAKKCGETCDANTECVAFEYAVDYGGTSATANRVFEGDCRLQSRRGQRVDCRDSNLDLYIKDQDATHSECHDLSEEGLCHAASETPTEHCVTGAIALTNCCACGGGFSLGDWTRYPMGCITDYNLEGPFEADVAECVRRCAADERCQAAEAGVSGIKSWGAVGDCYLSTSAKDSVIQENCPGYNLQLYVKERMIGGYIHHRESCIDPDGSRHHRISTFQNKTAQQCADLCNYNINPDCKAFEWATHYVDGQQKADPGMCQLLNTSDGIIGPESTIGSDGLKCMDYNLDLFVKAAP